MDNVTSLWYQHRPTLQSLANRNRDLDGSVMGVIPANSQHSGSRVTTSTGLGLPLCRSLAVASGGWVGLEDLDSVVTGSSATLHSSPIAGNSFTQFWCAITATESVVQDVIGEGAVAPVDAIASDTKDEGDAVTVPGDLPCASPPPRSPDRAQQRLEL